jgi:hypothetical protein
MKNRRLVVVFLFLLVTSFSAVCIQSVSAAYDATIWAWDSVNAWLNNVPIYEGNTFTGYYTPHTFTGLTGTHFYKVPSVDSYGNPFIEWSTGATGTLEVSEAGTYTARYYQIYSAKIDAFDTYSQEYLIGVMIDMDGTYSGWVTGQGHEFTGLHGTHTFTLPKIDMTYTFSQWNTGETSTTITVTSGGTYTGLYYSPETATPAFSPPGGTYYSSQSVIISCSTPGATIMFTIDGSTPNLYSSSQYLSPIVVSSTTTIKAKGFGAGMRESDTATATYTITIPPPKVATPTFSPPSGTYPSGQSVTITCSTSGATIRFTSDGSEPTSSSEIYSDITLVAGTVTFKAKAFKSGMTASDTASATYSVESTPGVVATPAFSPGAGSYSGSQSITITCGTSGATIRYTLDGSEPSSSSAVYSGPISVSSTTTVKAKAFKSGMTQSDTASVTYTINIPDNMRELTLSLIGSGSITPAPGVHTYANGAEVPVQATPSTKWVFDHWVLDGTATVTMNPVSITMGRDRDVVAVFIRVPPTAESCDITGVGKNRFSSTESIYVNGIGYGQQAGADVYVVRDVTWTDGMTIPGRVSGTVAELVSDMSGEIVPKVVWTPPLTEGKYDICVDVNVNGRYDVGIDALDDNEMEVTAGFVVPEFPSSLALLLLLVLITPFVAFTRTKTIRAVPSASADALFDDSRSIARFHPQGLLG